MKRMIDTFKVVVLSAFASCGAAEPQYTRRTEPLVAPYHDPEPQPEHVRSFEEKIRIVAEQYDLEPEYLLAVGDRESNLKHPKKPVYEPTLLKEAIAALPEQATIKEAKALASSYCAFQITGLTARRRNVHYSEINEDLCIELAAVELANWKRIRKGDKLMAAASYNGGSNPKAVSLEYARDVLRRQAKFKKAG